MTRSRAPGTPSPRYPSRSALSILRRNVLHIIEEVAENPQDYRDIMWYAMGSSVKASREILKRAHLARGSATLAPLKLTSLVTFLFRDKKVTDK